MKVRWHISLGALFSFLILFIIPEIGVINAFIIFLSSFLIDFDHYWNFLIKTGKISLFKAFDYHKKQEKIEKDEFRKGIRKKGEFHLFHTLEFHLLVLIFAFFVHELFFVLIGMSFHSILDIISMKYSGRLYRREYFLFNRIGKIKK